MKTLLATAALVTWIAPAGAMAQSFTVLPVERDARVSSSERMAAFTAVRSARVLGPAAEFTPVGELTHVLPEERSELTRCLEVDCAESLAREAGLDAVLVVAVWPGDDGRAVSVAVTIVEPTGVTHEADAEVGDGGVSHAATTALVAAARRRTLGAGVELRVESVPEGALVLVDETEVGVTPFVGAFEPGAHTVEVRLRGESEVRDVELEDEAVVVSVALDGEAADGDGVATDDGGRSLGSMLIPAVVGVGGITAGVVAIASVAPGTSCEGGPTCTRPDVPAVIGWAIAGTLLLAGAVVLWFALDDSGDASEGAALGVGPGGVRLRVPLSL